MNLNQIVNYFSGVKQTKKNQYTALCPVHDDKENSLSIGFSEKDNRILINCFAGCKENEILSKVNLNKKDLYTENTNIISTKTYLYHNENDTLAYKKIRKDYDNGTKKFYFELPNGHYDMSGVQRVLYNLPKVKNASTVYFVEGEKCADAIIKTGRVATTLDAGANSKWESQYNNYLRDKEIIIIPDNDIPGFKYAEKILKHLGNAKVIKLPDLPEKGDIFDWLNSGHSMNEISGLPNFDLSEHLLKQSSRQIENNSSKIVSNESQVETIIRLIKENQVILFHDTMKTTYAAIVVDGHREIWGMESQTFNYWLANLYYNHTNKTIKRENMSQALTLLSSKALFENKTAIPLHTRVAKKENAFWYDLSNQTWQAVKITADDWHMEDNPPILFSRYNHQKPQLPPSHNGNINKILKYINIADRKTLFLCWLVCSFIPDIPHAMPIFHGEKGAAKTTTCMCLKNLIDPSTLDTLTMQKDSRSFAVNLQQHWFLPFDNVSHISEDISDTLCRAITGGGIQQRRLFTNADDYIFTFKRCIALNGINNVATKPDLLDRAILIELSRIPEEDRKDSSTMQREFELDLPIILGGIFDVLSKAMKIRPDIKLERSPRMADFAHWGYAVGEALGGNGQTFLDEYTKNQECQNTEALNADAVAMLLIAFMQGKETWSGRMSDLFNELSKLAPKYGISSKSNSFPTQPNGLSRRLNGLKSNLQTAGILFETILRTGGTYITINNKNISPLPPYHQFETTDEYTNDEDVIF